MDRHPAGTDYEGENDTAIKEVRYERLTLDKRTDNFIHEYFADAPEVSDPQEVKAFIVTAMCATAVGIAIILCLFILAYEALIK